MGLFGRETDFLKNEAELFNLPENLNERIQLKFTALIAIWKSG